jgi:predicted O-methyltransferase YrrM
MNPAYSDNQLLEWTLELSKKFKVNTFFETGTYHGLSARIASVHFKNIVTVENNEEYYRIASVNLNGLNNCTLHLGNSPEIMSKCLKSGDSSIFFFLDAHWYDYWPILDELNVIKEKNLKPVIAIHDFFVPDSNSNAKFGYDSYQGIALNFDYIKDSIENIYGNQYEIRYSTSSTVNSGVIFIYPLLPNKL